MLPLNVRSHLSHLRICMLTHVLVSMRKHTCIPYFIYFRSEDNDCCLCAFMPWRLQHAYSHTIHAHGRIACCNRSLSVLWSQDHRWMMEVARRNLLANWCGLSNKRTKTIINECLSNKRHICIPPNAIWVDGRFWSTSQTICVGIFMPGASCNQLVKCYIAKKLLSNVFIKMNSGYYRCFEHKHVPRTTLYGVMEWRLRGIYWLQYKTERKNRGREIAS